MKLTHSRLKEIIKEELQKALQEGYDPEIAPPRHGEIPTGTGGSTYNAYANTIADMSREGVTKKMAKEAIQLVNMAVAGKLHPSFHPGRIPAYRSRRMIERDAIDKQYAAATETLQIAARAEFAGALAALKKIPGQHAIAKEIEKKTGAFSKWKSRWKQRLSM